MNKQHLRLFLVAAILLAVSPGLSLDVSAAGSWSLAVGASDLVAGAGSDLQGPLTSATDQITAAVSNTTGSSDAWRVEVYLSGYWLPSTTLYLRRSSAGSGLGSISGGTSYQSITSTPSTLFSGSGDRSNVALQLRIDGLSVADSPDFWAISLVYTVVDE